MNETTLVIELLVVAVLVAIVVKYVRLPYTIALVLAGVGVGLLPEVPAFPVDPDLWLLLFLPPLLFGQTQELAANDLSTSFVECRFMAFERNDRSVTDLLNLEFQLVHGWHPRLSATYWLTVTLPIVPACARDP